MFKQTDLDALDTALAQGVAEVRFADRVVRYRGVDEILKAREVVAQGLEQQNGTSSRKQIRVFTTPGW